MAVGACQNQAHEWVFNWSIKKKKLTIMSSTKLPLYCCALILKQLIHRGIQPMLFSYSETFREPNNIFSFYFLLLYVRHGGQVMETGDMPSVSNYNAQDDKSEQLSLAWGQWQNSFLSPLVIYSFREVHLFSFPQRVHFSCTNIVWSIPQVNKCFALGWSKSDTHCCTSVLLHSDQITSIHWYLPAVYLLWYKVCFVLAKCSSLYCFLFAVPNYFYFEKMTPSSCQTRRLTCLLR